MTYYIGSAGFSDLLIKDFESIYDDVRCYNKVFHTAERNVLNLAKYLARVHTELSKLRRSVKRLCKLKPLWFDENGYGVLDKRIPEIN